MMGNASSLGMVGMATSRLVTTCATRWGSMRAMSTWFMALMLGLPRMACVSLTLCLVSSVARGPGADAYLPKPCDAGELLARIKSVLRRARGAVVPTAGPRVRMGRCVLDLEKHALIDVDGSEEVLSASEFDLLKIFAENPNRPLARDWLLETVGHREMEVFDRAMDLRITRIRRKVEKDPAHPEAIRTVRGVGYMFVPPKD